MYTRKFRTKSKLEVVDLTSCWTVRPVIGDSIRLFVFSFLITLSVRVQDSQPYVRREQTETLYK